MPRNGSGSYSLPAGNPVVTNTVISSTWANNTLSDMATALTNSIAKDGQTTPTANLPMGGFVLSGLGAGAAAGQSLRYEQLFSQGAPIDIASAATVDIGGQSTNFLKVTGTTTITSLGANYNGPKMLTFAGALILTYNATTLITPTAASITTAAGDSCIVVPKSTASGTADGWKVVSYQRADGSALAIAAGSVTSGSIADGAVATVDIADEAVTSAKILNTLQPHTNDFRLTLTSGVPVTTSDVTGATTIYCTPYKGSRIALYDGSRWNTRVSAEFSLALGTLTSGKPYDVFCYDNSGTPTLEFLVWTNDTTRATALTYQNGILVKSGATTRRYMGTFYTTSTTQTEDSVTKRYLWNYSNRVKRRMYSVESTASWTYTTATWRQANNSSNNQINFLLGVSEDAVTASVNAAYTNTTSSASGAVGVGLDSTSSPSGITASVANVGAAGTGNLAGVCCPYFGIPAAGRHFLAWLEYCGALGTATWVGVNAPVQSGIQGELWS